MVSVLGMLIGKCVVRFSCRPNQKGSAQPIIREGLYTASCTSADYAFRIGVLKDMKLHN